MNSSGISHSYPPLSYQAPVDERQHVSSSHAQPAAGGTPAAENRPAARRFIKSTVDWFRSLPNKCSCVSDPGISPGLTPQRGTAPDASASLSQAHEEATPVLLVPDVRPQRPAQFQQPPRTAGQSLGDLYYLNKHLNNAANMGPSNSTQANRKRHEPLYRLGPHNDARRLPVIQHLASASPSGQGARFNANAAGGTPWKLPARLQESASAAQGQGQGQGQEQEQEQGVSSPSLYPAPDVPRILRPKSARSVARLGSKPPSAQAIASNAMPFQSEGFRELPLIVSREPSPPPSGLPPNDEPPSMSTSIDWAGVREKKTIASVQANDPMERRARAKADMRRLLEPVDRTDEPGPSSLQIDPDTLPIFLAITKENMHAVATRALQLAMGERSGASGAVRQQEWVHLLNQSLRAYERVERSYESEQNGGPPEPVLGQMEQAMRAFLRELLAVSESANVFNFGRYAPPSSDDDLDALVRLPAFRMLVDAVNTVHQHLRSERNLLDDRVQFAESSHDTYASYTSDTSRTS